MPRPDMFRDEAGALLALPPHKNPARFVNFDLAAKPKPTAAKPPAEAAPAKPAKNCDPPYTVDSQGEKVFKPECF